MLQNGFLQSPKTRYSVQTAKMARSLFYTPLAPRTAQTLTSMENCSRAMILGRFSLLQSSASRFQFWLPDMPIPWFRRKMVPAQWFRIFSVYSRAELPDPISGFQICTDLDFEGKWFSRNVFVLSVYSRGLPDSNSGSQICPDLDFEGKWFLAMILGRFSLLQSLASRS